MVLFRAIEVVFFAKALVDVRMLMTGLPARGTDLRHSVRLLCSDTVLVFCGYIVACSAVYSSPPHRDMTPDVAVGLPAIARRILLLIFASLKTNEEQGGGGGSRERGRAYIDAADGLRRQGKGAKAAGRRRDPRSGQHYTARGNGMPVGGRRWRAAGRRCNEGRFRRPANRHNRY